VTWNYPIDLFDHRKYANGGNYSEVDYSGRHGDEHIYNMETLGMRVDSADEIKAERANRAPITEIDGFKEYVPALIGFMMEVANRAHLHKNDWRWTVFIDGCGIKTCDFDLSSDDIQNLKDSGYKSAKKYFEWFESHKSDNELEPVSEKPLNLVP